LGGVSVTALMAGLFLCYGVIRGWSLVKRLVMGS